MMLMRWQLAFPGKPSRSSAGSSATPPCGDESELYNQLGAMHGTIMVFFGVVPLAVGAFGNYVRAAPDRRAGHGVPEAEHGELLVYLPGRRHHVVSFFVPGGAAQSGWTSYPPLSDHRRLRDRRFGFSEWSS